MGGVVVSSVVMGGVVVGGVVVGGILVDDEISMGAKDVIRFINVVVLAYSSF